MRTEDTVLYFNSPFCGWSAYSLYRFNAKTIFILRWLSSRKRNTLFQYLMVSLYFFLSPHSHSQHLSSSLRLIPITKLVFFFVLTSLFSTFRLIERSGMQIMYNVHTIECYVMYTVCLQCISNVRISGLINECITKTRHLKILFISVYWQTRLTNGFPVNRKILEASHIKRDWNDRTHKQHTVFGGYLNSC